MDTKVDKIILKEGMSYYSRIYNKKIKYHIVKIFEDDKNTIVVIKFFGIYKRWWHYETWDYDHLISYFECGLHSFKRLKDNIITDDLDKNCYEEENK